MIFFCTENAGHWRKRNGTKAFEKETEDAETIWLSMRGSFWNKGFRFSEKGFRLSWIFK